MTFNYCTQFSQNSQPAPTINISRSTWVQHVCFPKQNHCSF